MSGSLSTHDAIHVGLLDSAERVEHARAVRALVARNALLSTIERGRKQQRLNKKQLAERAGLEASVVRRVLTAKTANPTTDNAFRLLDAAGVVVEAVLPSGERVGMIGSSHLPSA